MRQVEFANSVPSKVIRKFLYVAILRLIIRKRAQVFLLHTRRRPKALIILLKERFHIEPHKKSMDQDLKNKLLQR
jgi:hypothetical protein